MLIKRVSVIGMGTMGSQIGIVCARAGFPTYMVDTSSEQVEKGASTISSFLGHQKKKGKMSQDDIDHILSLISTSNDMSKGVAGADLVIEAVFEDIETKSNVFKILDEVAPKETIFASNTSTLWITELCCGYRTQRSVHWRSLFDSSGSDSTCGGCQGSGNIGQDT